jgi:hypothetical protein
MYKEQESQVNVFQFAAPWGGRLDPENRWVKLAEIIPWGEIEKEYASKFTSFKGNVAKPARLAFGALVVQAKLDMRDRECADTIAENMYIQYFLGFSEFQPHPPVSASTFVYFRKRITAQGIARINDILCGIEEAEKDDRDPPDDGGDNDGTLILDATCAPQDIKFPTDVTLLNEAREKLEMYIGKVFKPFRGALTKPKMDREKARKAFLDIVKGRKWKANQMRSAVGRQLKYVRRDLESLDRLLALPGHGELKDTEKAKLATIRVLYAQQEHMFRTRTHRVDDRIVSISQSHVRPIIRGKAGCNCEFGAKISISVKNGYSFVDRLAWDNFSEGSLLQEQCLGYYRRFGCWPERILADKAYRTQDNHRFCKEKHIAMIGPKLGRPPKDVDPRERDKWIKESGERNEVESKFGVSKRRYGLDLILCKLKETSETEIMLQFIVMNAEHRIRVEERKRRKRLQQAKKRQLKQRIIAIVETVQPRENYCFAG